MSSNVRLLLSFVALGCGAAAVVVATLLLRSVLG
jgi:hypothetical protein